MTPLSWLQPRDHRVAARTVLALVGVAALVSVVTAPIAPPPRSLSPLAIAALVVAVALIAVLCWTTRRLHEGTRVAWAGCPIACVALLVAIDLLTQDASITAQIFFLFPALYGASLLRREGAVVMLVLSLAGELVVVASLVSPRDAVVDFSYVAAALVTTVVLLTRSGERQAALMAELEQQAAVDSLTGLVTRRVLDKAATAAITGGRNDEGNALILLDVDKFKSINDRYGHPGGDDVLVQLARMLEELSRPTDVVCRMGGDELALLLPGCGQDIADERAATILAATRAHRFRVGADMIAVSVSIGVAHAPTHAVDLRSLYAAADAALYAAKNGGRDQVVTQVERV